MLILPRKTKQTICIGNDVTITILRVQGNKVHIGIDAPKKIAVHRQEIYQSLQANKGKN